VTIKHLFKIASRAPATHEKPDPATAITRAAANVGLELQPERLNRLVEIANTAYLSPELAFINNGLMVVKPERKHGKTFAEIDFRPGTRELSLADTRQPQEATKIALNGLTELQNYGLLVDAGIAAAPDILYGKANWSMSRVATRLGFSVEHVVENDEEWMEVQAPFKTVHDNVFSPQTIAFSEMLSRRLETMHQPGK